ncbi:MAG: sugar ABC transporter permease [Clostridia bacterium]|nr:sugar ABC transporter permease [Clostridia bacterium]
MRSGNKKTKPLGQVITAVKKNKSFYFMLLPAVLFLLVFSYLPMFNLKSGGVLLAFKHYRFNTSFLDMEWVGLKWFVKLFNQNDFWRVLRNTLIISFGHLMISFPAPIILALMMNEVRREKVKRFFQTIFTFPNFLSWIIVAGILRGMLLTDGTINTVLAQMGMERVSFLTNLDWIRPIIFSSAVWKNVGWGTIIYLATIAGIDSSQYEAALIDGASRWQRIRYVTWPGIKGTATILLVLQVGSILNAGFDQIFQLTNDLNYKIVDILDIYLYKYAFGKGANYGLVTAAGLLKSVVNFSLLLTANHIVKKMGQESVL